MSSIDNPPTPDKVSPLRTNYFRFSFMKTRSEFLREISERNEPLGAPDKLNITELDDTFKKFFFCTSFLIVIINSHELNNFWVQIEH